MAFVRRVVGDESVIRGILLSEVTAYIAANPGTDLTLAIVPGEGSIAAMLADTQNNFVFTDDGEPRIVVIVHAERPPVQLFVNQSWGPTLVHDKILVRLCNAVIARGFGNTPISFFAKGDGTDLPIVQVAIAKALTGATRNGKLWTTTANKALASLTASGSTA